MQKLYSLQEFDAVKSHTMTIAISSKEKSHRTEKKTGWRAIRDQLAAFHNSDKTMLQARWDALSQLRTLCNAFVGDKNRTEKAGQRAKFAATLENQAYLRLVQEYAKAHEYGDKVNAVSQSPLPNRRSPGASVGSVGGHTATKFERALPEGSVYHGQHLATTAQAAGVGLTGQDFMDAYALRAYVKKIEAEGLQPDFKEDYKIPYWSNADRATHAVTLEVHQLTWKGAPLNTVGIRGPEKGVSDHAAMYAIDQLGRMYVSKVIVKFNHSCFTAGDTVLCAGMITVINGRLNNISNGSGHYGPGILHLLDACDVILGSAYNDFRDAYVLYSDFANLYGRGAGKEYRVPFLQFTQAAGGMVANPAAFEVHIPMGDFSHTYVDAWAAFQRGAVIPNVLKPT